MLKLLRCTLRISEINVSCERGFCRWMPLFGKREIRRTWIKNTQRFLKRTEEILSGGGEKNKKRIGTSNYSLPEASSVKYTVAAAAVSNERLSRHLNKLLNSTITRIITSGEVCPELNELGFEIDEVTVLPDLSAINVTWAARGDSTDNQISALLPTFASQLRSSLTYQKVMWQVPPIQFVKNDSATQPYAVEELLKVADMGPDFEPTPLGHGMKAQQQQPTAAFKTTDSASQSDADSLSAVAGPGGSVELVTSKTHDHHTTSFAEHTETWHNHRDDVLSPCPAETSTDDKLDDGKTTDADNDRHGSMTGRQDTEAGCSDEAESRSEIRSDLYGVDHTRLWQQVVHAKRKVVDRSYALSDELAAEFTAASRLASTRDVTKPRRRYKNERRSRRDPRLLSCHYHNNIQD